MLIVTNVNSNGIPENEQSQRRLRSKAVGDEDIIIDDENNEPNITMELSFNNKEKMNDSGSTFLPDISHVNSAEAFRTSNVNQSTSDAVVEEEKIHELLDKAISSTGLRMIITVVSNLKLEFN
ncbi:unnamed protein product [Rotaria magnacalcarata]|uniref:Uncharacterized protein n=3 Tax=Rotaria magnacalcarata TaxID=392030 RepID=A0A820FNP1_9BILA|nr:unnamed protein product [Rotaria magnacalcarata]